MGLIPGWGTKIPHAVCPIKKKKIKKTEQELSISKTEILISPKLLIIANNHSTFSAAQARYMSSLSSSPFLPLLLSLSPSVCVGR